MSDKSESDEFIWSNGKSVSHLTSSENSMSNERKEIIRQALEFDIIDIRTYTGYKGDLLVEITTMKPDVVKILQKRAGSLGLEVVIHKDVLSVFKMFCISAASNIYELKEDF